jgi:hypothetical protein
MSERKEYTLSPDEFIKLKTLRFQEEIWPFWFSVGERLGIDYKSIIGLHKGRQHFSALPKGHKYYWCYPYELKCRPVKWFDKHTQ